MKLLLDTHILIGVARRELSAFGADVRTAITASDNTSFVSAASLWEIAIKTRLGKLDPGMALEYIADFFATFGMVHLAIDHRHAVYHVDPMPPTRDPFDRLLLAQCAVEGLRLITTDRVLAQHPLAWRAS
jgi:PIN domain nuclease of toxin-antitoxin system